MSTRPAAPDPQRDRHIAFPDEAPAERPAPTLPPTAWAPAPGSRGPASPPPPTRLARRPHRARRGHAAWWLVGAFFAFPALGSAMWGNGVTGDGMMGGAPMEWHQPGDPSGNGWPVGPPPDFKVLSGVEVAGVQPDQPTFAVPAGATTYRVEVAGGDPRGGLQVVAAQGDASVPETAMPFAVEVHTDEPGTLQWVVARGAHGQADIQCRVYVGEDLVAISTGQGMAECAIPPP